MYVDYSSSFGTTQHRGEATYVDGACPMFARGCGAGSFSAFFLTDRRLK